MLASSLPIPGADLSLTEEENVVPMLASSGGYATPSAWFNGDSKRYALHGAIDDATGQITELYLCKNKCMYDYFQMLRRTIENFGCPISLYADRHTFFQSFNKAKAVINPSIPISDTQFGRALKELSIELIPAYCLSKDMKTSLVTDTIHILKDNHMYTLQKDAIFHSDQGVQYTIYELKKELKKYKLTQSMSRRGNCWDNAPQELFLGHMKDELHLERYETFVQGYRWRW